MNNPLKPVSELAARRPFVVVLIISVLVVGVSALGRLRKAEVVDARITFEENASRPEYQPGKKGRRVFYDVTQDPNFHTADRLRDASAIAMLLGLRRIYIFQEKQPAPANVTALLSGILPELERNGVTPSPDGAAGVLVGPGSNIYVRYRIAPFAVEVVSIPKGQRDGDNIIVRLPVDGAIPNNSEARAVSIYTHPFVRELQVPAPFSSDALITAQGWKAEEMKQSTMTPEQIKQIANQLGSVR